MSSNPLLQKAFSPTTIEREGNHLLFAAKSGKLGERTLNAREHVQRLLFSYERWKGSYGGGKVSRTDRIPMKWSLWNGEALRVKRMRSSIGKGALRSLRMKASCRSMLSLTSSAGPCNRRRILALQRSLLFVLANVKMCTQAHLFRSQLMKGQRFLAR